MLDHWIRTIRLGMKNILLHKLRSSLTALGIVFGVCSVIAMMALGKGATFEMLERIKGLGATNIIVRSVKPVEDSSNQATNSRIAEFGILFEDYDRIRTTIPTLTRVLPIWEQPRELRHHDKTMDGRVVATSPEYLPINNMKVQRGRFLRNTDMERRENVAVLAAEVAQRLFPAQDPIEQAVRLGYDYYRVIGVCEPRQATAAIGGSMAAQEYDRDIYIPLSTARLRFGDLRVDMRGGTMVMERTELSQLTLTVSSTEMVEPTATVVKNLMETHHLKEDYAVTVPLELLEQAKQTEELMNWVFGSVGGISLLVGGIGIMNIMLATVTERTREIGIRRSLGAQRKHIIWQFLTETIALSSLGGVVGLGVGVGISYLLEQVAWSFNTTLPARSIFLSYEDAPFRWDIGIVLSSALMFLAVLSVAVKGGRDGYSQVLIFQAGALAICGAFGGVLLGVGLPFLITDAPAFMAMLYETPKEDQMDGLPAIINPISLPIAFGISVTVGIVFGAYPAYRAANMDPIEALRHD